MRLPGRGEEGKEYSEQRGGLVLVSDLLSFSQVDTGLLF